MGRRISLFICLAVSIAATVLYSQQSQPVSVNTAGQNIYVEQLQSVNAFKTSINGGTVSLKANLIGVLSSDGSVKLFGFPSLDEKIALAPASAKVNALSFSISGQTLALCCRWNSLSV